MEKERKIKIITSLCVCLLVALVLIVIGQVVSIVTRNRRIDQLKEELAKLDREQTSVEDLIEYRESDSFVEQYAREILDMIKDGEQVHDGE